ncbi:DUF4157 domain-containing protein [Streptomyces sp. NPDC001594]|uniref:eCIS core domain-containing protein n=1 Tax=Streptomyces sp. NPDC001594 TaxID=3364590 RepID=UPI0036C1F729
MIWPLRRKRREQPPAVQAPAPGPAVEGRRDAWRRAEPLRTTATAPQGAPTIGSGLLVTGGTRAPAGPAARTAQPSVLRLVGTVTGLATARPRLRAEGPSTAAEPPLREPSQLPPPFSARRAGRVAPSGTSGTFAPSAPSAPFAPEQGSLTRADDRYVGAPRPATPAEPAPPWMRGEVPGMSPEEVAALFPGFTGLHAQPSTPPSAGPAPAREPAERGAAPRPAPPARPSLAESRRRAAPPKPEPLTHPAPAVPTPPAGDAPPGVPAAPAPPAAPASTAQPTAEAPAPAPAPTPAPAPAAAAPAPPAADAPPATPAPAPAATPADPPPPAPSQTPPTAPPARPAAPPIPVLPPDEEPPGATPRTDPPTGRRPLGLRPPWEPAAGRATDTPRRALPHPHPPRTAPSAPAPAAPSATPPARPARGTEATPPQGAASGGPAPPPGPAPEPGDTAVVPRDMAAAFARLYGVDVSAVPVHRGRAASERAARMSARAFTEGGAVFLPKEAGDLESGRGRGLLAHELTHAVQQERHGAALPAEDTREGLSLEIEALVAERFFRGEPGAPEPAPSAPPAPEPPPAVCDHEDTPAPSLPPMSWTPETGMVTSGVQRASADEITEQYLQHLNDLRKELGKGGRVSSVSELTHEERIDLELRLRKAGTAADGYEDEEAEERPLDWTEFFAQTASQMSTDLLRPFYSPSVEEQRANRDEWRTWAEERRGSRPADRSFLAEEEDGVLPWAQADDGDPAIAPAGPATPDGEAVTAAFDDADLVRPLYRHLVEMLEHDGLLPGGSAAKITGPLTWTAPSTEASAADEGRDGTAASASSDEAPAPLSAPGPGGEEAPGPRLETGPGPAIVGSPAGTIAPGDAWTSGSSAGAPGRAPGGGNPTEATARGTGDTPAENPPTTKAPTAPFTSATPETHTETPGVAKAPTPTTPDTREAPTQVPGVAKTPAPHAVPAPGPVPGTARAASAPAYGAGVLAALYPGLVARLRQDGLIPAAAQSGAPGTTAQGNGQPGIPSAAWDAAGAKEMKKAKADAAKRSTTKAVEPEEEERPLDWAEFFAQSASELQSDVLRPFYSYDKDEEKENRGKWRRFASDRIGGRHLRRPDRSFLDDEDEAEEGTTGPEWTATAPVTAARPAGAPAPAGGAARPPAPVPPSAAALPAPLPTTDAATEPAPLVTPVAEASAPTRPPDLAALVEAADEVALRLLSDSLYPLLIDEIRRDLLTGWQRGGFA